MPQSIVSSSHRASDRIRTLRKYEMTEEKIERLKALSSKDRSQWEIAQELRVTQSTISRWQIALGLERAKPGAKSTKSRCPLCGQVLQVRKKEAHADL